MLNPFFLQPESHKGKKNSAAEEEFSAQLYGHSLDTSTPRPSVGLWVGKLLIRMGHKLTKQDDELSSFKEHA